MQRAFSLIEVMVTVALVGIVAALAVPAMLPEVHKATLEGGAENVASFLARARAEAMTTKRCVRVWVPSTATHEIVAERLNTFDCDVTPATLPAGIGIDGTANVWIEFAHLRLDSRRLAVSFVQVPSSSASGAPAPGSVVGTPASFTGNELRFRPSGRIFSNDDVAMPGRLRNDDAVLRVTHADLVAGTSNRKNILVDSVGLLCVFPRGLNPPVDVANGGGSNLRCP